MEGGKTCCSCNNMQLEFYWNQTGADGHSFTRAAGKDNWFTDDRGERTAQKKSVAVILIVQWVVQPIAVKESKLIRICCESTGLWLLVSLQQSNCLLAAGLFWMEESKSAETWPNRFHNLTLLFSHRNVVWAHFCPLNVAFTLSHSFLFLLVILRKTQHGRCSCKQYSLRDNPCVTLCCHSASLYPPFHMRVQLSGRTCILPKGVLFPIDRWSFSRPLGLAGVFAYSHDHPFNGWHEQTLEGYDTSRA